jgi:hypothetical protein
MASLAGTVRWWEKVEEPTTVWQALLTDDGLEYYVNTETNETTWEKPEELYVFKHKILSLNNSTSILFLTPQISIFTTV